MLFVFEGVQLILIIGYSQNEENEKTSEFECFFYSGCCMDPASVQLRKLIRKCVLSGRCVSEKYMWKNEY